MDAMMRANEDRFAMARTPKWNRALALVRDLFEAPEGSLSGSTGTAANSIAGNLTQPWETIFCTKLSHQRRRM
jgi:threonine aldolase